MSDWTKEDEAALAALAERKRKHELEVIKPVQEIVERTIGRGASCAEITRALIHYAPQFRTLLAPMDPSSGGIPYDRQD